MTRINTLQRIFWHLTGFRWPILVFSFLAIAAAGAFVPKIVKDTGADAFIDPQNPALIYRNKVKETFGLRDPIVLAVVNRGETGVFNPTSLELVAWLTEKIEGTANVDPERVFSIATESNIVGTDDGMLVEDFFEEDAEGFAAPLGTQARADEIRAAIDDFPLYRGNLVARDGTATLIVVELVDEEQAQETYDVILNLLDDAPLGGLDQVYVAGEGAVAGYLATYIDRDAQRLNPLAGLIITLVLVVTFLSVRGALLPNIIVLATAAFTFGTMAAFGVRFYVITNALIVNLIGIAVADSIHILSQYYEEQRARPTAPKREIVTRAMAAMWRPVTLTTLTTIAGFLALAAASDMPPMRAFGLFGALGVAVAWVYSMTFLPAALTLWPSQRISRPFRPKSAQRQGDFASRLMLAFGRLVLANPKRVVALGVVVAVAGALGAARVIVEDQQIENFHPSEPIYQADKAINRSMDGTYYLDIVVETPNPEGLHRPENLRKIEQLQRFLETLPQVGGTTSLVDYIKQMNRAVNENRKEFYVVPDDPLLISQLFLLYSASADPTDFEEEVDSNYQNALVRANVSTGVHSSNRLLVNAVEAYLTDSFNSPGIVGTVTGRINVNYHWIKNIADNHASSVLLALLAVTAMAAIVFRSLVAAAICILPIGLAVLIVYAVMGFGGVWLGVGTSMFASIAIGLGIDFAIHSLDRLKTLVQAEGLTDQTLLKLYPETGRALFYNFAAVALGFAILITSDVPPLVRFGSLVAVAVSTAFLASMTLLPAIVKLARPSFLGRQPTSSDQAAWVRRKTARTGLLLLVGSLASVLALHAAAEELPDGTKVMEQVVARNEGSWVTRDLRMELTDRSGTTRVQETKAFRKYYGAEKRTVIFYVNPTNIKGTAFLTYDYPDAEVDDDQWLYLPALRKVRRISASNRGDYFLGTDFTYEEIKKENKLELSDYAFNSVGWEDVAGNPTIVVEGLPVDEDVAKELGYSRVLWRVDPTIWMSRKTEFWDTNGNHLKTITLPQVEQIDGIWTALRIQAVNHKTGHRTNFAFSNVDYSSPVADQRFEQSLLKRGF